MSKAKETNSPEAANGNEDKPNLTPRQEIELIKRENLTGQQLRMARRLAQKHGIEAKSDLDAVRLLRKAGVDPFNNAQVLNFDEAAAKTGAAPASKVPAKSQKNLPAKAKTQQVAQPAPPSELDRLREVQKIQRDLVKRRRRRLFHMLAKLFVFVGLPTIIAGYYYNVVATPMYSTKSAFTIQQADNPLVPGAGSGLLQGLPFATSGDAISVQTYLTSIEAMVRLDKEIGFKSVYQSDEIDDIQRLQSPATNEKAHKIYTKRVKIGFDPTEGVLKMEVIAPSPELARSYSQALLSYAEERVDQQSLRKREDQLSGASASLDKQMKILDERQDELVKIQEQYDIFDTTSQVALLSQQIGSLEIQLIERKAQLAELENNTRPNAAKVAAQKARIDGLQDQIAELKDQMTKGREGQESLAKIGAEQRRAQAAVEGQLLIVQTAAQNLQTAELEVSRQTRFVEVSMSPVLPEEASYPKKFENTLLSFLVFGGIFLLLSLTASILREQVSN